MTRLPIKTVLVTGATGFVGTAVCQVFLEAGIAVHALVRNEGRTLQPGVIVRFAKDLSDKQALRAAVEGVDAVVHLAARAHITRQREKEADAFFQRTNVEGTANVFDAARAAGVRRFIFASSLKVMGRYPGRPFTETDPPDPTDPYGRSKLAAEDLLQRGGSAGEIEIAIVRLPLVYGPGVRANMLQLFRFVDRGIPLPLLGLQNRRTIIYSKNAADAFLALTRVQALTREVFFVGDSQPVSTERLVRVIARALGRPARLFPLPQPALAAIGMAGDLVDQLLPFPLTSDTLHKLTQSLDCDTSKIEAATGYRPRSSTAEGLAATADWYMSGRRQSRPS